MRPLFPREETRATSVLILEEEIVHVAQCEVGYARRRFNGIVNALCYQLEREATAWVLSRSDAF